MALALIQAKEWCKCLAAFNSPCYYMANEQNQGYQEQVSRLLLL